MKTLLSLNFMFRLVQLCHRRSDRLLTSMANRSKDQFIILEESTFTETIKKSKFITRALPANSIEEALKILQEVSDPKATHNCWAYNSVNYQRFSDDGEPSGTAGRPMLNALTSENVVDAIVVCTRYYGGINLGTGGLARAYGGTALQAVKLAKKEIFKPLQILQIQVSSRDFGSVQYLIRSYSVADQIFYNYSVDIQVRVPVDEILSVQERLLSSLGGRGTVSILQT